MPEYNIPPTRIFDNNSSNNNNKTGEKNVKQPKRKRGRPKKTAIVSNVNDNYVDNSVEVVNNSEIVGSVGIVGSLLTAKDETSPSTIENTSLIIKKKTSPKDLNQICMACGKYIPDTPDKINLAMFLDAAPYKFNTVLNEKGRIILCHDCHDHLIAIVDKELKKIGCKQKFE